MLQREVRQETRPARFPGASGNIPGSRHRIATQSLTTLLLAVGEVVGRAGMVDRLSRVSVLWVGRVMDQISGGRVPKGKEEKRARGTCERNGKDFDGSKQKAGG